MTRGRRLAIQVALLPVLVALAAADDRMFQLAVAIEIIIVWPISLAAAGILVWLSKSAPDIDSLRESADNAVTTALISTAIAAAGAVAVGRVLGVVEVPGRPVIVLLAYGLVLAGVPSIAWMGTLRRVWLPMLRRRGNR